MENLLQDIERFIASHEMAPTTFGVLALNDGRFVEQLRNNRDLRTSTVARVRTFMAEYQPSSQAA